MQNKEVFKKFDQLFYEKKELVLQDSDKTLLQDYFSTKKGWLYIMRNPDHNYLKIGRTTKTPMVRSKTLSNTGVLNDYEIIYCLKSFNQVATEKALFKILKKYRVKGEFFDCNLNFAVQKMNDVINQEKENLKKYFDIDMLELDITLTNDAFKEESNKH